MKPYRFLGIAFFLGSLAGMSSHALAGEDLILDFTHPLPTFMPDAPGSSVPDTTLPWDESVVLPTGGFGVQAVLEVIDFPTADGVFKIGRLTATEHTGTHIDAPNHFLSNARPRSRRGPPRDPARVNDLDAEDLVGPVVLIDISARVQAELDKNGGDPHPDTAVTDFSNDSANVVGPDDIEAIADELEDGTWLVLNFGWSRFYLLEGVADDASHPYINGFNHPGMNRAAVDRLIEVMEDKDILINGIVADNWAMDSGENTVGDGDFSTNAWHAHVNLLPRGIKFVENAANLGQLAMLEKPEDCTLVVGAPKHIRGTAGQSRVLAICED